MIHWHGYSDAQTINFTFSSICPSSSSSGTLPVGIEPAEGVPAELGVPTPAAIPHANGSLLFSQETDDLHVQANVLEHYRELYPGLYRTVMTIQRVSGKKQSVPLIFIHN